MTQIPIVRARPGVRFDTIAPAGFRILAALDVLCKAEVRDVEITCGTEGHKPSDPHPQGRAYDVSVKGLTPLEIVRWKKRLEQTLGARFAVLYEVPSLPTDPQLAAIAYVNGDATGPHFHIQLAKSQGGVYPPKEAVGYEPSRSDRRGHCRGVRILGGVGLRPVAAL